MKLKIKLQSLGDDGYHIFCKVKVNGTKCRALIDTGASKTVIGKTLSLKLGLAEYLNPNDNQMTGIHPGEMNVTFARVETISFGKLIFNDIITGLIEMEHVNMQYATLKIKPFDLIIGGDILFMGNAVIDYKNKFLELNRP